MNNNLHQKKAREIAKMVNNLEITATEVTNYFIERAEKLNPIFNAFNSITKELALTQAENLDERLKNGEKFKLAGVPIAIKDNICVKNTYTTCSSKILENFKAPYESSVTEGLWENGGICLGKTNMDEFAMGSSTEHSAFGRSKNPYDIERVPGGSSGGSAVAVSAQLCPLALGSDTGGSIRQPAALCGIVGLKPTYGLVSRYGLIAFASSLDQIGPFATDIEDTHLLASVLYGHDCKDSTSLEGNYLSSLTARTDLKGVKIGLIKELMLNEKNSSSDIVNTLNETIENIKSLGAELIEISLPITSEHSLDVYYIIAPAEASSNLARYDGVRYGERDKNANSLLSMYANSRSAGFGDEVKRRIIIGTYALSSGYYDAYYKKAQQVRRLISDEFENAFKQVDILLSPTSPITAFKAGDKMNDPLSMYLCDIATIPANLAGIPSLSLNCGFNKNKLPIGLQLMSNKLKDQDLLNTAQIIEKLINV